MSKEDFQDAAPITPNTHTGFGSDARTSMAIGSLSGDFGSVAAIAVAVVASAGPSIGAP